VSFNRKMLKNFDFGLLFNILLLSIIGIITVSSATQAFSGGSNRNFVLQIVWTLLGLGLLIITVAIDYSAFKTYSKFIYVANIIMLVAVIVMGKVTNGANSWFGIGTLGIQPSEFMKISLIILFAKKIEEFEDNVNSFKNLGILFLYAVLPLGMIAYQPDLGTTMVMLAIIIGMLFMGGLDLRVLIGGLLSGAAAIFAVFPFLEPYQQNRLKVFIDPASDPLKNGYNLLQSKIAVGSGQLFGMGLGKGLQSEGKFLPVAYSDFIFSVLGEEFGFVGSVILILLYASMAFRCLKIARIAKDKFGSMVVAGVVSMLIFQMFQNIGMTIGLMPITGITLPFVSYGGSSMFTSMVAIGLVLNVGIRRHKINF